MDNHFIVSSSPHIRADEDTRSVMLDVLVALFFPLAVAVYFFGWRSLTLTLCSVFFCMLFEALYCKLLKKPLPLRDLSAPVTGVLLAFCLPVSVPYWILILGDFFAIVIVKQLYGGLGKNFLNPALAARVLVVGFSAASVFTETRLSSEALPLWGSFDAVSAATPLAQLQSGENLSADWLQNLFLGQTAGCIGEVSAAVLLLGGLYLVVRRVITPRIPLAFMGTVALLTFLFPRGDMPGTSYMLYNLLSGGLILGAVFMATDYSTSPVTKKGQWIYGIGCGLLTVFFRYFASMPEGVCFSILLMNTLVWALDKAGRPGRFGKHFRAFKPIKRKEERHEG